MIHFTICCVIVLFMNKARATSREIQLACLSQETYANPAPLLSRQTCSTCCADHKESSDGTKSLRLTGTQSDGLIDGPEWMDRHTQTIGEPSRLHPTAIRDPPLRGRQLRSSSFHLGIPFLLESFARDVDSETQKGKFHYIFSPPSVVSEHLEWNLRTIHCYYH